MDNYKFGISDGSFISFTQREDDGVAVLLNGSPTLLVIKKEDKERFVEVVKLVMLNSDIQSNGASQGKPDSSTSVSNQKSYSELQEENELINASDSICHERLQKLSSLLKEKEDEIRLLEEREVLWSNKHQLLNDEILKYKALAEAADKLIALNGWGNEQEWVTYKKLKDDIQSKN